MEIFVLWAGAIGAWLLVGGPLFQGTLELWELSRAASARVDRKRADQVLWFVPPLHYLIQTGRLRNSSSPGDELPTAFTNRATGWFAVSGGALLIAAKETWELAEFYDLSVGLYWTIVALIIALCNVNVGIRMIRLAAAVQPD